jgi:superfamily I DNA/RNA helicase
MKFYIYEKFMDSFIRLPKGTQKKAMEFMEKFRTNPKSAAINLEKIISFKDQQLRSARIDQTYRAIVHVSKTDDVYHLLWADHHDDAYAWAKNKVFEWNNMTQSYQVFDLADEIIVPKPTAEAKKSGLFVSYSKEQLESIGVPTVLIPSLREVIDLNGLQAIEKYLPEDVFENVFYLVDGLPIEDIIKEIEEGKAVAGATQEDTNNNKRFFFEITDKDLESIFSDDFNKWRIFLHPSQRKIVNSINKGPVKVTGLAGTGKTVCALHRAKYLIDHYIIQKNKPLLFTTFTKSLVKDLKESLTALGVDESKIEVIHIHGLAVELAKKNSLIPVKAKILEFTDSEYKLKLWEEVLDSTISEFDADFLSTEFSEIVVQNNLSTEEEYLRVPRIGRSQKLGRKDRIEIWKAFDAYIKKKNKDGYFELGEVLNLLNNHFVNSADKPYSYIIADEIQDFSNVELRLMRSMTEEHENDLFLVGDPFQKIYSRKINFSKAGINVKGNRSKQLKVNYRTTEEIKRLALSTVQGIEYDNFDGERESSKGYISLTHGEKPVYSSFDKESEEFEFIRAKIEDFISSNSNIAFNDICIACRTKNILSDVKKHLHNSKIPYYDVTTSTGKTTGVHLTTYHNVKGLEFKIVFLTGINSKTLPLRPVAYETWDKVQQVEFDTMERSLLYVAMTRAIQQLIITGTGKKSDWVRL